MFSIFNKQAKKIEALKAYGDSFSADLGAMHPIEKASILVFANCTLAVLSRKYSRNIMDNPVLVDKAVLNSALSDIMRVVVSLQDMQVPPEYLKQLRTQYFSARLVALTLGCGLSGELRNPVIQAWKTIWLDKERLSDAVLWIRKHEKLTGQPAVPPLPTGRQPSDIDLMQGSLKVPGFLKKTAPKNQKAIKK